MSDKEIKMADKENGRLTLSRASIEIFPSPTVGERIINIFGESRAMVNITSSPNFGIESTLGVSRLLVKNGFDVVPHIGAGEVQNEKHLVKIMEEIDSLGINKIFVVRGDGKIKGKYKTSAQLMRDLSKMGKKFKTIGIGGYPEGIEGMSDEQLLDGIRIREELAREMNAQLYIVTQMCFEPEVIVSYAINLRRKNISLPIILGLPGPEKPEKLYHIASRCGVGQSKDKLLSIDNEIFSPKQLVEQVQKMDINNLISGYNIYSFNNIKRLSSWLNQLNM